MLRRRTSRCLPPEALVARVEARALAVRRTDDASGSALSAILFDRDRVDHLDDLSQRPQRLRGSKLLWVDIDRCTGDSADEVARAFDLHDLCRERLAKSGGRAVFHDHGRYIHLTTYTPSEDDEDEQLIAVECVVGENWVITAHDRPVPVLEEFAERVSGSGDTGVLDGPVFLATLLEWVLNAYSSRSSVWSSASRTSTSSAMRGESRPSRATSSTSSRCGARSGPCAARWRLTARHSWRSPSGAGSARERRVGRARFGPYSAVSSRPCRRRATRARRSSGSFDVLIARTGHRTNDIMKVLTLTSVILLPGALIAGLMGMNFKVGLFEMSWLFYVVLAVIVLIAPLTVGIREAAATGSDRSERVEADVDRDDRGARGPGGVPGRPARSLLRRQ